MTIGKRIKNRRKEVNLSADYLAEKLGVSRATIFRYEKGDIAKIPIDIISKLAILLNTTPDYLMGWSDDDKNIDITPHFKKLEPERQQIVYDLVLNLLRDQNSIDIKNSNQIDLNIDNNT